MNVLDHLKSKAVEDIKSYCKNTCIDAGVAMMHVSGDFNLSTLVRNANFFGFKETLYVGGSKKWDRRGSVGTHHYTDLKHIKSEEDFVSYVRLNNYRLIAVENNIPEYEHKSCNLFDCNCFESAYYPMFIFGEEKCGLSKYMLDQSDLILTIPAYGSVRSLNVGTTSGIVMGFYRSFIENN